MPLTILISVSVAVVLLMALAQRQWAQSHVAERVTKTAISAVIFTPLLGVAIMIALAPRPVAEWRFRVAGQYQPITDTLHISGDGRGDITLLGSGSASRVNVAVAYSAANATLTVQVRGGGAPVFANKRLLNGVRLRSGSTIEAGGRQITATHPRWPLSCALRVSCSDVLIEDEAGETRRVMISSNGTMLNLRSTHGDPVILMRGCLRGGRLRCSAIWAVGTGDVLVDRAPIPMQIELAANGQWSDTIAIGSGASQERIILTGDAGWLEALYGGRLRRSSWSLAAPGEQTFRLSAGVLPPPGTLPILDLSGAALGPRGDSYSGALSRDGARWTWHGNGTERELTRNTEEALPGLGVANRGHIVRLEYRERSIATILLASILAVMLALFAALQWPQNTRESGHYRTALLGFAYILLGVRALLAWRTFAAAPSSSEGVETTAIAFAAFPCLLWLLESPERMRNEKLRTAVILTTALVIAAIAGPLAPSAVLVRIVAVAVTVVVGVGGLITLQWALLPASEAAREPITVNFNRLRHAGAQFWRRLAGSDPLAALDVEPLSETARSRSVFALFRAIMVIIVLETIYVTIAASGSSRRGLVVVAGYLLLAGFTWYWLDQRSDVRPRMRPASAAWQIGLVAVVSSLGAVAVAGQVWPELSMLRLAIVALTVLIVTTLVVWRAMAPVLHDVSGAVYPRNQVLPPSVLWFAPPFAMGLMWIDPLRRLTITFGYALALAGLLALVRAISIIYRRMSAGERWSHRRVAAGLVLSLTIFGAYLLADRGLLLLTVTSALLVTVAGLSLIGWRYTLSAMVVAIALFAGARAWMAWPADRLGVEPVSLNTPQMRYAVTASPARLEMHLFQADRTTSNEIIRTLQQDWAMRAYSAQLKGKGYFNAPFVANAIPAEVAMTDNAFSVFVLSEHGFAGGVALLGVYIAFALLLLHVAVFGCRSSYATPRALLFIGLALFGALPALYMAAANTSLLPLTGQNVPLLGLRSTADAAFGSWILALAIVALPRYEKRKDEYQAGLERSKVRLKRMIAVTAVLLIICFRLVTNGMFSAAVADVAPFRLDRFNARIDHLIARGHIYADTAHGDTVAFSEDLVASVASPGTFLQAIAARANSLKMGRFTAFRDCADEAPPLYISDRKVRVQREWCAASLPLRDAEIWRGDLTSDFTAQPALLLTHGAGAVALVAGAASGPLDCRAVSFVEMSSTTLRCGGAPLSVRPVAQGTFTASVPQGAALSQTELQRGSIIAAGTATIVTDSIPRHAYGFWRYVNGTVRRSASPSATALLGGLDDLLATALTSSVPRDAPVLLTIDRILMDSLQAALRDHCEAHTAVHQCSITLVDGANGDILALASSAPADTTRNDILDPNMREHRSASVVKPLLAGAALSIYPGLRDMRVPLADRTQTIAGWPLGDFMESAVYAPCANVGDFVCFLAGSNNQYAATLGFMAMAPAQGDMPRMQAGGDQVQGVGAGRPDLFHAAFHADSTPLAEALQRLYGAAVQQRKAAALDSSLWQSAVAGELLRINSTWGAVSPQRPRLPLDVLSMDAKSRWALATFMYGDRENYWTNVSLVRGLVRILNDRGTELRLIRAIGRDTLTHQVDERVDFNGARRVIIPAMRDGALRGTFADAIRSYPYNNRNGFVLVGKSGTLTTKGMNASSSFLFAVTPPFTRCRSVAGIIYMEFDGPRTSGSAAQLFGDHIGPLIARHLEWEQCR